MSQVVRTTAAAGSRKEAHLDSAVSIFAFVQRIVNRALGATVILALNLNYIDVRFSGVPPRMKEKADKSARRMVTSFFWKLSNPTFGKRQISAGSSAIHL